MFTASSNSDHKKRVRFAVGLYLFFHLLVIALPIRSWPFTDYPMFARSYKKEDQVVTLRYQIEKKDGSTQLLGRSFSGSFSDTDWNLYKLVKMQEWDQVQANLKIWFNSSPYKKGLKSLSIIRFEGIRPTKEKGFRIEKKVLKRFEAHDLSQ